MKPYYILRSIKFDENIQKYSTVQQAGMDHITNDNPKTTFQKTDLQILDNFIKYDFTSEMNKNSKGRAYGTDEIFESFILIKEDKFYFSHQHELIILATNKETFNKFHEHMADSEEFKFEKIEIDFAEIIKNKKALGIESIWVGEIPEETHVSTVSFHGCKIEDSNRYEEIIREGAKIKNLSLIYDHNGQQEKIMITKQGGIIVYDNILESDVLDLIEDIYKNLLLPNLEIN
ncbi:hypothetical protein GOQ29_08210 [Clostridium sp. D2Q-14]|uniref:hypothetical protein n=1 Tax=Anaeromonas gelatinilytica TaxID=2683194 RepID=UPI00193B14AC|nr:hypothetical protein [Anaeromonas gelatinilytica]MBS4535606.1 hypothetical protein [Anaeromonas gelatinilytica]